MTGQNINAWIPGKFEIPTGPSGFWLCYHSDWSGVAAFLDELEARRFAMERGMLCEFHEWGEVR